MQDETRIKDLERYLNYSLNLARAKGEFPKSVILGFSKVFMCSNSEEVEKWRKRNCALEDTLSDEI